MSVGEAALSVFAMIGLGANLDDPARQLEFAFTELDALPGTRLVARSSRYASAPVGYLDQPDFVNAVARIETTLAPRALLAALLDIEHRHGRERSFKNAPRTLDLDLLLYGNAHFVEPGLTLPHPRLHQRAFVLRPLVELAPDCVIPGVGRVADCLPAVTHQPIRLLELPPTAVDKAAVNA
jgi:2-amino-4-hydroxy-6-hydroxymethyldihydropteridine diphosphokinase